jgi:putative transcriptional regulator
MTRKAKKKISKPDQAPLEDATADILETVHRTATGLHQAGLLKKQTMQEFDELCLPKLHVMGGADIKQLRERLQISQPVFAKYLNTTSSTIAQWEQGKKKPNGLAQRLLNVIEDKGLEVLL